jgi:hypothetical protein
VIKFIKKDNICSMMLGNFENGFMNGVGVIEIGPSSFKGDFTGG